MNNQLSESDIQKELLIHTLEQHITEHKKHLIQQVLSHRTRYVTVALEDTYQSHNANAIIRSCEIFGLQDIHIIQNRNSFNPTSGIARGALKWLNIHTYTTTAHCFTALKQQGYGIVATVPDLHAIQLDTLPIDSKMALFFGTELKGLTGELLDQADYKITIPMYGFTQSFNVSVSVALCLQSIIERIHKSSVTWHMSNSEQLTVQLQWLKMLVTGWREIEKKHTHQL